MKNTLSSLAFGTLFSITMSSTVVPTVAIADVYLPTANCGYGSAANNCLIFGDFSVYSLGLLQDQQTRYNLNTGYQFVYKPNDALVNVIDGAEKGTTLQGKGTAIDDPFRAMNGTTNNQDPLYSNNMRFLMAGTSLTTGNNTIPSDPAGGPTLDNSKTYSVLNSATFTTQSRFGTNPESQFKDPACFADMNAQGCMQSWDTSVAALTQALAGKSLVFMFNNNETGDSSSLAGQDLLGWARATLYKADGTSVTFTLSGANTILSQQSQTQTAGVDDMLTSKDDLWAHVHSEICVKDTTGEVWLGGCETLPSTENKADWHTVNQSLGADQAGFAIFSQALNEALYSGDYLNLAVDIRLSHLNNGGDNVWIMAGDFFCEPTNPNCSNVPEPTGIALIGLALALLSMTAARRHSAREH